MKNSKIQSLLITHLLDQGAIELVLPDGLVLELGITQESEDGSLKKCDDYCWVIASQKDRSVSIDSYNLGLRFSRENANILLEDEVLDQDGQPLCVVDVV
jgi:hypothetical protein